MNWLPIIGILMLIIGVFQLSMTIKTFKTLKVEANHSTSVFMPMALWSGALMGIVFLVVGIGALLV
ncbi:hypothetical protein [Latilactobacillus curvatus]|uniref:Immunity protein n=1 Tax=Latilactobacillus curvatus JCM 1096 = DSM 20019 TaxID=1293592 RepID=A0AAJ0PCR0_LATCU|nr:hypothetical protein [Latilactobacillus curvatus]ASN61979.1 hypothetical protein CGZ47_05260 [Latilactobacillus curvatus]AZP96457.1 hypothetical protein CYK59_05565 [Latilactobacillus curvatus]KRK92884.1 hypothetical protein FC08_GL000339 [Latilactobacillus curvatus JCM 1096 = DSM 20019]MCP8860906.1 hypothetical protein [Latilactobacillus curvatus]MCP8869095.1 hypothetical protein [Latilactobacillus curvatus]